jgi:DNA-binding MarR family transcriptional regulator
MPTLRSTTEVAAHLRLAVARTARRLRQEAFEAEGRGQLSPSLSSALVTIENHGPLTPSELADRERIKRPTATRIVAKLEELELVTRTQDPNDGRASLVATSAAGRELLRRLRTRKTAYLAKRLDGLDTDEIATLDRAATILERLLENEAPQQRRTSASPFGLRDRGRR